MNKQDLKEGQEVYVKGQVIHTGDHLDIVLAKGSFIGNAIILHHEKPVVPQFVAEIIEYYKRNNATLYDALREKNFNKQYSEWLLNEQNAYDKVAKAWLDGYEVEKEFPAPREVNRYLYCIKTERKSLRGICFRPLSR